MKKIKLIIMYEIIKMIVEIFAKGMNLENLHEIHEKRKLREIGKELYLIYIHLNEIVVVGDKIVDELEEYLEDKQSYHSTSIMRRVVEQKLFLWQLQRDIRRCTLLKFLDVESYMKLQPLIFDKFNLLDTLLDSMDEGFPLLESSDIRILTGEYYYSREAKIRRRNLRRNLSQRILDTSWDESTCEKIKRNLEEREPRKNLNEIREVLEKIRMVLERNFSVADILLAVGDDRWIH